MKTIVLIHKLDHLLIEKTADDPDLTHAITTKNEISSQTLKTTPIRTILIPIQIIPIPLDLCLQKVFLFFENHN